VFGSMVDGGQNGGYVKWPADEYIVATASASVAGLVGNAYIRYIRE